MKKMQGVSDQNTDLTSGMWQPQRHRLQTWSHAQTLKSRRSESLWGAESRGTADKFLQKMTFSYEDQIQSISWYNTKEGSSDAAFMYPGRKTLQNKADIVEIKYWTVMNFNIEFPKSHQVNLLTHRN